MAMGSLTPEQKSVLRTTFLLLQTMQTFLAAVEPVAGETDQRLLRGMVDLSEVCLQHLAEYFVVELLDLAEDRRMRGGQ